MHKIATALVVGISQCFLAAAALAVQPGNGAYPVPIDASASQPTRDALTFIGNRTLQTNSSMILGQHLGGPGDVSAAPGTPQDTFDMQQYRIASKTMAGLNAFPRLVGGRYDANATVNGRSVYTLDIAHVQQVNLRLEQIYNTYHSFVSVTATPRNPWDQGQGRAWSPLQPNNSLSDLFIGKRTNPPPAIPTKPVDLFWADMDTIAQGLAGLNDSNGAPIPVLFRPFAEFNTNKYYYVNQDPADFVKLWKQVVTYYEGKGVHNLIYCWEAWTWGSTPDEAALDAWWPGADQVDVVGGAFYFHELGKADYFGLNFPAMKTADVSVFNDLMGIAVTYNKPFGATQWAVDSEAPNGDDADTLTFMNSVDALHSSQSSLTQHMSFVYYWTNTTAVNEEVQAQANPDKLVDDPRVVTVSGLDGVLGKQGTIESTSPSRTVTSSLRTGFDVASCNGCEFRSILSFAAGMLPAAAQIDSGIGLTLLLTPSATQSTASPFTVAGQKHCLDAGFYTVLPQNTVQNYFGATPALATDDFDWPGAPCVATTNDWRSNMTTGRAPLNISAATAIGAGYLNRNYPTQFRAYFKQRLAGSWVSWQGAFVPGSIDDVAPQLIFSYTLPD